MSVPTIWVPSLRRMQLPGGLLVFFATLCPRWMMMAFLAPDGAATIVVIGGIGMVVSVDVDGTIPISHIVCYEVFSLGLHLQSVPV